MVRESSNLLQLYDDMENKSKTNYVYIRSNIIKKDEYLMLYIHDGSKLSKMKSSMSINIETFNPDKDTWKLVESLSKNGTNVMLIPPLRLMAANISDYIRKYGKTGWREAVREIIKVKRKLLQKDSRFASGIYVSTHGHGVNYLHIRFENPKPKYYIPEKNEI